MKTIYISGSKSESNRILILQKLLGNIKIENISNAKDTQLLFHALNEDSEVIDIHHAGTAMRFLTAYLAIQEGRISTLTGSERMKQRPIHHLVNALRDLGADIEYMENEGFPPLKIRGKKLTKNLVQIPANISSQFITALMLIGTKMERGLTIRLLGKVTSLPYIEMTMKILQELGIKVTQKQETDTNSREISSLYTSPSTHRNTITKFIVESDWSSASYFYSTVAIGKKLLRLKNFKRNSLQGDSKITAIYASFFGVETIFNEDESILLRSIENFNYPERILMDMNDCPDIAQTLCVTASAMKIHFHITGLSTLKVKETDRLIALQNELKKIGVVTEITDSSIRSISFHPTSAPVSIATYEDHRMAMSFAPLKLLQDIEIQHPEVVEKSYPNFWKDFYHAIH